MKLSQNMVENQHLYGLQFGEMQTKKVAYKRGVRKWRMKVRQINQWV